MLAVAFCALASIASAATINVTFGDRVVQLDSSKICKKQAVSRNGYQLPVRLFTDGSLHVGTEVFPKGTCARKIAVGSGTTTIQPGLHTGQTAEEVATDLGLPAGSVGTIDPGPVVASGGVIDTNHNGTSNDEANAATAEGATQSDAQPDAGTTGDKTNGGNDGVSIF